MVEIQAADARARMHGVAFCEFAAGEFRAVEQRKEGFLFSMIRLRGITWCRANSAIFLADQFLVGEVARLFDAAGETRLLMQVFRIGFGQTVG